MRAHEVRRKRGKGGRGGIAKQHRSEIETRAKSDAGAMTNYDLKKKKETGNPEAMKRGF